MVPSVMRLSRRLDPIKPSATLALNAKAKALVQQGVDVVGFAAGEPDFDTPAFIGEAGIEAIRSGFTRYTATAGIPELRKAICEKLARDNQLTYTPEQILVSSGAKHSLYNIFQALLNEGDEVVIFAPYWVSYPEMVQLAGGKPVIVETREEDGFAPDPEAFRRALGPKTRAVIINSPSNPTGAVISREALAALGRVLEDFPEVLVVSDDIYEKLRYVDGPFVNIANAAPALAERTVVVNGMSKAFAMTGWRLGYAAGPKTLIAGMQTIQDQSTSNASSVTQKAGLAALLGPSDEIDRMVTEYRARRDLVVDRLNAIPGISCRLPEGAFYVFPNVSGLYGRRSGEKRIEDSLTLSQVLLEDFRVAAVPGAPFGAPAHLRLSFVTSRETLEKGLSRIEDLVRSLS